MIKNKLLVLFSIFAFSTSSCGSNDNRIPRINLYDKNKEMVSISYNELTIKIDGKLSFAVYLYSDSCSLCKETSENLNKYIKETNTLIYKLNASRIETLNNLKNDYPNIFGNASTPELYLINNSKLTYSFSYETINNYSSFTTRIKNRVYDTGVYFTNDLSNLVDTSFYHPESFIYLYDSGDKSYIKSYKIIEQFADKTSGNKIFLVDKKMLKEEEFEEFFDYLGVNDFNSLVFKNIVVLKEKLGITSNSVNYAENFDEFESILNRTYSQY